MPLFALPFGVQGRKPQNVGGVYWLSKFSGQRTGLYAGWELEFRLPMTVADLKYKVEFKNKS